MNAPATVTIRADGSLHIPPAPPRTLADDALPFTLMHGRFLRALYTICHRRQASVTSLIRTHRRNKAVGGDARSYHLDGFAADLVPDEPSAAAGIIIDAHAYGLDAVNEGDHVHIELDHRRTNANKKATP